ncbi:hypothetical protein CXB49_04395 [Chromobacterium sp. ATCC 53434]|uniref:hypothetical protein n=1 Tax=Chromobacterium TaxID=535 RepID=UPI000C7593B3|nr:hypothetical protein [Chromobacterium sp. ATCC 53434]AUH50110.1 hypothetical protein CXB49_04395 [Chromobacterium sp. ATCC 53434]
MAGFSASKRRALAGLAAGCIGGCAMHGVAFVTPGETVRPVEVSEQRLVYEYAHVYGGELSEAGKRADVACGVSGRHAVLLQVEKRDAERSRAVFRCQ